MEKQVGCNTSYVSYPQLEDRSFISLQNAQKRDISKIIFRAYRNLIQKAWDEMGLRTEEEIFNYYIQNIDYLRKDEHFVEIYPLIYEIMTLDGSLKK